MDIDASKDGTAAMFYHINATHDAEYGLSDLVPLRKADIACTRTRPVLFLSRCLNPAELNYWPTELENRLPRLGIKDNSPFARGMYQARNSLYRPCCHD
jgi:hypothetical protein